MNANSPAMPQVPVRIEQARQESGRVQEADPARADPDAARARPAPSRARAGRARWPRGPSPRPRPRRRRTRVARRTLSPRSGPSREPEVHRQRRDVDASPPSVTWRQVADRREHRRRRRTPRRSRAASAPRRTCGSESTRRWPARARAVRPPPSSSSGRRPKRSDVQPTTGRIAERGDREGADRRSRRQTRRRRAGRRRTGTRPAGRCCPAVKNASAATNRAMNAGVTSRDGEALVTSGRWSCASSSRSAAVNGSRRWADDLIDDRGAAARPGPPAPAGPRAARRGSPGPGPRPGPVGPPRRPRLAPRRTVPIQGRQQLRHALAGRRGRDQDLRSLRARVGPTARGRAPRSGTSIARSWAARPQRAGLVALVDDDQVGDLEEARLDGLDLVAHLRRLEHDGRVRRRPRPRPRSGRSRPSR